MAKPDFDKTMRLVVLPHECGHGDGFVDNKHDPGGITKYGVSFRFLKDHGIDINHDGDVTADDIRGLQLDQALGIYRQFFWVPAHCDSYLDYFVAAKVMDVSVNMGPKSYLLFQRAAVDCGQELEPDGHIGPQTIRAINACDPSDWLKHCIERQKLRYLEIIEAHPTSADFKNGWFKRADWPWDK
jgi:lysozyme family protein